MPRNVALIGWNTQVTTPHVVYDELGKTSANFCVLEVAILWEYFPQ